MKFVATIGIGLYGCDVIEEFEIDGEDLEGMSDREIDDVAYQTAYDMACEKLDIGIKRVEQ